MSLSPLRMQASSLSPNKYHSSNRTAYEDGLTLKSRIQPRPCPPPQVSNHPLDKTTNIDPEAYDIIFDKDKPDFDDPDKPFYDPSKGDEKFTEFNGNDAS